MEKRFRSLRIIGTVFKILAWITLVLGVIGGIIMVVSGVATGFAGGSALGDNATGLATIAGLFTGLLGGVTAIIFSVLGFLCLYAYGDAIYLALAIEENTRETAYYLKGGDTFRQP